MPTKPYKNIIALIYDFDGTLSPLPMQEYTILPQIGIKSKKFWESVKEENKRVQGEEIITYMMKMLKMSEAAEIKMTKKDLGRLASKIRFYPGVVGFFPRINKFVKKQSNGQIKVKHYIISSGLKEILQKISIRKHFSNIFASEYHYDYNGIPKYPKLVITDTVKTQFLFRINKGKEKIGDNINTHMSEYDRPIPFSNMIYIGDGLTDVPCMTVTLKNGGYAIAVYRARDRKGFKTCFELFESGRVEFIASANYKENSDLDKCVQATLKTIIQGILFQKAQYEQMKKYTGR